MTAFDREMQRALLADAQKLRDEGVECADPIFFSTAEDIALIARTTPVTFPRAESESHGPGHVVQYSRDCRNLMRAWLVQELASFFELFESSRETIAVDELEARIVAEELATKEIGRAINANENRLLIQCVREIVAAKVVTNDAQRKRDRENQAEVL